MDFITGLPKSKGKSVIMVIVDRLTKYTHFCALSHPFKASTFATAFMEIVQKIHGSPKIIVSDRDPIFMGHFWTKLFSCLGTQLAHGSSYHPQSDGQNEIVNTCLEGYLCCSVYDKQTQWLKWLPLEKWWYNTSFHSATKMTPFMALYGYHPPSINCYHPIKYGNQLMTWILLILSVSSVLIGNPFFIFAKRKKKKRKRKEKEKEKKKKRGQKDLK
jgi:hypothetical protein